MRKFCFVAALLALAACSDKTQPPAAPSQPSGALVSAYTPKVEAASQPIDAATAPVAFLWDFSKGGQAGYELTQTLRAAAGPSAENTKIRTTTISGHIDVTPMSPASGRVTFSEMNATHETVDEKGQPQKASGQMAPPQPVTIGPDGGGSEAITRLMLPLPGKTLKPGESAAIPFVLPLRAGAVSLPVPALMTLTYTGDATREGRKLARFDSVFTLGDFKPPPASHGEYKPTVGGVGRAWFDPATGRLVETVTALRFALEARMPKTAAPDKKEPPLKEFETLHLDSDSFFRVVEAKK